MTKPKARTFKFPSERPGLDLLATLLLRGTAEPHETLRDPADLARWFVEAGIVDRTANDLGDGDVATARTLREAINGVARERMAAGRTFNAADIDVLNRMAGPRPVSPQLAADAGSIVRSPPTSPDQTVSACLAVVARDAIEILGSPLASRIRGCANPDCQALFLDLSRRANRRWCFMGEGGCGNRAKTAALRGRRRAAGKTSMDRPNE